MGQAYRNGCRGPFGDSDARADADDETDGDETGDDELQPGASEDAAANGGHGDSRPRSRAATAGSQPKTPTKDAEAEEDGSEGDSGSEDWGVEVGHITASALPRA
jgi:hypothetical protein